MSVSNIDSMRHHIQLVIIVIILFLESCNNISEREDYQIVNNVPFGYIHRLNDIIYISIKEFESLSNDEITNFIYCLEKKEREKGRATMHVAICKYFCYDDELNKKDILIWVHLKKINTESDDDYLIGINKFKKIKNGKAIDQEVYVENTGHCN